MKIDAVFDTSELERKFGIATANLPLVTANALNITGAHARQMVQARLPQMLDRPTPYTVRKIRYRAATPDNLSTDVIVAGGSGSQPNSLRPEIFGGQRSQKPFEYLLGGPAQYFVPGRGAVLDQFGNPSRGVYTQILSQLRLFKNNAVNESDVSQSRRHRRQARKKGESRGDFFQIKPGDKDHLQPGIYQRILIGGKASKIVSVFDQHAPPNYTSRFPFSDLVSATYTTEFETNIRRAINELFERTGTSGG